MKPMSGLSHHRDARLAWFVLVFVALTLGLQVGPGSAALLQFSRAAYASGAWWQLLTSQWVHLSGLHAVANAMALLLIVAACSRWVGARQQIIGLSGGYIGVALVLAFDPDCAYYAGASGALHGLLAGNAVQMLWGGDKMARRPGAPAASVRSLTLARRLALVILAGLAFKLWLQGGAKAPAGAGWLGLPVYLPAHEAGMAGGMVLVLLVLAARALWAPPRQPAG
jgi:rhomboid family GlyGly-CTERM serine protease